MLYRNTKTGAVIDTSCTVVGGDWINAEKEAELNSENDASEDEEEKRESGGSKEETIDLSEMTVAELKEFAAENEIDLGSATRKDDIIKIIAESDAVEVE